MGKFVALPRIGRLAFTTFVVVFALATSAQAEDSSLTDEEISDLERACIAAVDVCKNSCALENPNHETSFNEGLLYDFCMSDCQDLEIRCQSSIPTRTIGSGSSGGGVVLDPGTGNPRPPSFDPKPFSLPGSGGVLSK